MSWCYRVRSPSEVLIVTGLVLSTLGAPLPAVASDAAYVVVVANDVPLTEISLDELRRVFLLKRVFWKAGQPIRLILPATGQPGRAFLLDSVCQKTEGVFRRLVMEAIYRGEVDQPPKVAVSDEEALKLILTLPRSVTLLSGASPLPPAFKTLRVDGKLAAEAGYPLVR